MADEPTDEDHIEACRYLLGAKLNVGLAPYTNRDSFVRDLHTALHAHPGYTNDGDEEEEPGAAEVEEAEPMSAAFSGRRRSMGHARKTRRGISAERGQQCARAQLQASGIRVQPARLSAGARQLSQARGRRPAGPQSGRRGQQVLAEVLANVAAIAK